MPEETARLTDTVSAVLTGPDGRVKAATGEDPEDTPAQGVSTTATGD